MKKSVAVFMGKLVMVLLCVIIVLPMVMMPADALAQKTVYVLGASDFQADTDAQSAEIVKSILKRVVAAKYTSFDGFLFCGDYSKKWSYGTSLSGLEALQTAVTGEVGSIPNQFFVEGNHDNYNVPGITKTGGYETDYYDVYVLSESDFGWAGETSANAVAALANDLERWLAERTVGEKPVFVLTHIPLHYSTRTREIFDGQFNKYIVDVLNAAGQRGLNIVVLYGHNHGGYYDHYLGGATNYIAKGDTLWVGDPSDVMCPPIGYTLNFTYMNAGFTGYYSGVDCAQCKAGNPIDGELTMSVFEITGDQVVVRRFDKDGEHAVKEKAGHFYYQDLESTYGYTCHTKTYASPQTIPGASMELTAHAALGSERFQVGSSVCVAVKNPTAAAYTWTSSNPQVASVQPGANGTAVVTGAQPGSTMITVSAGGNAQTATFYVTVSDPENDTGAVVDDRGEYFYRLTDAMYNSKTYVIASHNRPGLTNVMTAPDTGYGLKNTADTRIHAYPEGTPFILSTTAKTRWRYWLTDETNNAGTLYSEAWSNPWWYIVMASDDKTLWMHDDVAAGDKLHTLNHTLKSAEWKWDRCLYSNVKSDSGKTLWLGYSQKQGCWWIRDDDQWDDETLDDGTVSWLNTYIYEQTHNVASAKLSNMRGIWDGTSVGTYIVKTWTTGQTQYIPVTLDMLTDRNGKAVDLTDGGTLTGLTVTYNGVDITHDYSLTLDEIVVKFSGKHYYRLVDRFTPGTEGHYLIVSENTPAADGRDDAFAMQSAGIDMAVESRLVHVAENMAGLPCLPASEVRDDMVWRYTNWTNADGTGGYYYYWLEQLVDVDGETLHNFLEFTDGTCSKFKTTTAWTNPGYNPGVYTSEGSYLGLQTVYVKAGSPTGENRHIMFDGNNFNAVTDGGRVWGQEAYIYEKTEMTSALFRTLIGTTGEVAVNSTGTAETGTYIQLLLPDGTLHSVSVTVDMLYRNGKQLTAADLTAAKTLTGLTLQYGGETLPGSYALQVTGVNSDGEPDYPTPGSVRFTKKLGSSEFDFGKTGVARIDLAVTGVPQEEKLDILVVMDTSSSIDYLLPNGQPRIEAMRESLKRMIDALQKPNSNGTLPDVQIAVAQFNDYTYFASPNNQLTGAVPFAYRGTAPEHNGLIFDYSNVYDLDGLDVERIVSRGGTNYDVAFQTAYEIVSARKASHPDRQQVVVFMTDGICFQYNYISHDSGASTTPVWKSWLQGTLDEENNMGVIPVEDFYHKDGKQWMAEAIKGSADEKYKVIWNESRQVGVEYDPEKHIRYVNGLDATIYSIGFGIAEGDGEVNGIVGAEILKKLASDPSKYYNVALAQELNAAFADIASQVRKAATGGYVLDKLGADFRMQLGTVTDSQGNAAQTMPCITIKSYELYNAADANGNMELIGTRKPNSGAVLETISFSPDGKAAYSDKMEGNILGEDGVIRGYLFCYNNNPTGSVNILVNGKTEELPAQTMYWYIGNISQREVELSYYVYLHDSLAKGQGSAGVDKGTYLTNALCCLTYTNTAGQSCKKEPASPQLSWENATVNYAFYYVNEDGTPIVNLDTGETGAFTDKVAVILSGSEELNLNVDKGLQAPSLIASNLLPEGYRLFDSSASYTVHVNSGADSGGRWEIGHTASLPLTTYVTGSGFAPTTQVESNTLTNYDDTTVWFAVVCQRRTQPDVVVIDYGIPVDIDVLSNDSFTANETVDGLCSGDFDHVVSAGHVNRNADNQPQTQTVIGNENTMYTASVVDGKIRFALNKGLGTQMNDAQVFAYRVPAAFAQMVDGTVTNVDHYYYATVTVIPATTIYYEDSFVTFNVYDFDTTQELTADGFVWAPTSGAGSGIQQQDRPGVSDNQSLDADNVYGYDSAYQNGTTYSLGSAMQVRVGTHTVNGIQHRTFATAKFTFTGTGFDLIAMTTATTGAITIKATNTATGEVHTRLVDTYYGYRYMGQDENNQPIWEPAKGNNSGGDMLYQVPVMKLVGLDYGTYDVVITASYAQMFDHGQYDGAYYDFYLDAIRIYDPAQDGKHNPTIEGVYRQDKEGWPAYTELRSMIISAGTFDGLTTDAISGVVFIDGNNGLNSSTATGEDAAVVDYTNFGPNNEVYLANDQAISFGLFQTGDIASIQIAMKSVTGTAQVRYYGGSGEEVTKTIATATDLYYDITALNNSYVVIENIGTGILSITNIKVTYGSDPEATEGSGEVTRIREGIIVDMEAMNSVLEAMNDRGEQDPVEPVLPGPIEILSASLSFEDQILMNLYYSADFEAEEMGLLTWPAQPEQVSIDSAQSVFPGSLYDGENHRYMVKTDGIPAKKLGDDQYMAVYARLSDGSYVYSRVISYSPKRYALSRLEKSADENLKALCAAMLNYGAAAQEYFGYNTDSLMNSDLTAEQKALVVPYSADLFAGGGAVDEAKAGAFAATDGFSKKSATVSFEGAFAINYYFTPNETVDGTVTFYYWTAEDYAAAETLTADNATGSATMVSGDGGAYWAEISGIAAKHMDAAYYVAAVYTSQGRQCSSGVIAYAVSTYCVKNSGGAMGELAQATAVYGYHAKRYFGLG